MSDSLSHKEPKKRSALVHKLKSLPLPIFRELRFAVKAPSDQMPGDTADLSTQVIRFLEWAESPVGCGLKTVESFVSALISEPTQGNTNLTPSDLDEAQLAIYLDISEFLPQYDLNELIQKTQVNCQQSITEHHSEIRLLNHKVIAVDQLYVDVYLLDTPEYQNYISPNRLLEKFNANSDRLILGKRIKRKIGFNTANKHKKLAILGKPGSGKTTFLKHLAVAWSKGEFQKDLIAILIEFRSITDEKWNLLEVIDRQTGLNSLPKKVRIESRIEQLEESKSQLVEQKSSLDGKKWSVSYMLASLRKEKLAAQAQQDKLTQEKEQLREEKSDLLKAKKKIENEIEDVSSYSDITKIINNRQASLKKEQGLVKKDEMSIISIDNEIEGIRTKISQLSIESMKTDQVDQSSNISKQIQEDISKQIQELEKRESNLQVGKKELIHKISNLKDKEGKLEKEIETLQKFNNLSDLIRSLRNKCSEKQKEIEILDNSVERLNIESQIFEGQIKNAEAKINSTQEESINLESQKGSLDEKFKLVSHKIASLQKSISSLPLFQFLIKGQFLILMDGLDEVANHELRKTVQEQLSDFSQEYSENRFIFTCRTQTIDFIPLGFTAVEVAEFNQSQIQQFMQNWFIASGESSESVANWCHVINTSISNKPDFRELMVTPVLLSLICLVFQDSEEVLTDRAWLYERGIDLLLNRWNSEKRIDNWEIGIKLYQDLDIREKIKLLSKIAVHKFENPDNFVLFSEDEVINVINQTLELQDSNLGKAILETIEAQHGLLIERADGLWSFSHLTFQEYFAIEWLKNLSHEALSAKLQSQRWREIVAQLVKSQQPADEFLKLLKRAIDYSVCNDLFIQDFLNLLLNKSQAVRVDAKPAAVRAFYFALLAWISLDFPLDITVARLLDDHLRRSLNLSLHPKVQTSHSSLIDLELDISLANLLRVCRVRSRDPQLVHDCYSQVTEYPIHNSTVKLIVDPDLGNTWACVLTRIDDDSFSDALIHLAHLLPKQDPYAWWQHESIEWVDQLYTVITRNRQMGQSLNYAEDVRQSLYQYHERIKFLVELMNIEGAVSSRGVRAQIEATLFCPWTQIMAS